MTRAARLALGLTVNQFAAALGVSPITVRRWEMSPEKPSHRVPGAATQTAIRLMLAASNEMRKG
jgi:DNA-binding transcriptional regulator YiaG